MLRFAVCIMIGMFLVVLVAARRLSDGESDSIDGVCDQKESSPKETQIGKCLGALLNGEAEAVRDVDSVKQLFPLGAVDKFKEVNKALIVAEVSKQQDVVDYLNQFFASGRTFDASDISLLVSTARVQATQNRKYLGSNRFMVFEHFRQRHCLPYYDQCKQDDEDECEQKLREQEKKCQEKFDKLTPKDCANIQHNFGVMILALERHGNGGIEWFPDTVSQFKENDIVYYATSAGSKGSNGDGLERFESEIVEGQRNSCQMMGVVELTPRTENVVPGGAPSHLGGFVLGGQQNRADPSAQGALYFRSTFGAGLAIHLSILPDGSRVEFPGPEHALQEGERLFMISGVLGDSDKQAPLPERFEQNKGWVMRPDKFDDALDVANRYRHEDHAIVYPPLEDVTGK